MYDRPVAPPTSSAGSPTRIVMAEVKTVNANGTVDVQPVKNRAAKVGLRVPGWYSPAIGDRVLICDLDGDRKTPIVIAPVETRSGGRPALAPDADLEAHEALVEGAHGVPELASGEGLLWDGSGWAATDLATQAELAALDAAAVKDGDTAGGDLTGTYPNPSLAKPALHEVSFENGWATATPLPAYYSKDPFGRVHLDECWAHGGSATSATITTLPPGFRPAENRGFPTRYWSGSSWLGGVIRVWGTGAITLHANTDAAIFSGVADVLLDHISFRAAD